MTIPLIRVEEVSKIFPVGGVFGAKKYIKAVDNVNLEIGENEILALVGESGCGKSTLGKLMLALLKPSSGSILYYINHKYKDVWSLKGEEFREYRRNAQLIPQDPYSTLNPMKKVISALTPPLLRYKIARNRREAKKMAAELLEMVGLSPPEDFFERFPCRLSGGQLQRIAIARAISVKPKFIVADEAVSMLDASLRIEILNLLLNIRKRLKTAYLFITHDFAIARYFARNERIAVMYLGNIVEMGRTEEIIQNPLHPYTQTLLATVPIPDPKLARKRELPKLRSLEIPSLISPPPGCKFNTRCPYAESICEEKTPELREVKGRLVACHLF
ncbi:MAG: peptide ABC transporter ATP-binding protein [Thermoprotei archaeon]|nr:MAG: peptide ABC transporter ATP-binding protein [Thermoprotei archaeon]